jgi:PAS domain-containing protein
MSALLAVLADQTWRVVAGAAIWVGAAVLLGWLVLRSHKKDRAHQVELDRAEARYRALLDGLPLVTWLTNPGDRSSSLYVSPSIGELTGYSP